MSMETLKRTMHHTPGIVDSAVVAKYLNTATDWNAEPRMYFGMGGGSQYLTLGTPLDVVGMVMAGEVLRRNMGLKKCYILCADVITRTNPFPTEDINRVLKGEMEMMRHVVKVLGFPGWEVVLHSDLHAMRDGGEVTKHNVSTVPLADCCQPDYVRILQVMCKYIDQGIADSPFCELGKDARGHKDNWHFALETALTEHLVGNGIHLGWFIPSADVRTKDDMASLIGRFGKTGLKRMDEEPFDSYHHHTVRKAIEAGEYHGPNRVSAVYTEAGIKLAPASDPQLVQRVPPYITYDPKTRILVADDHEAVLRKAGEHGKWRFHSRGPLSMYWKKYCYLAELLGFPAGRQGDDIASRIGRFLDFLNSDGVIRGIYAETFPKG